MNRKILLVDDEKNIIRSLDLILKSEGFEVAGAGDLKQARLQLQSEDFSIFLIDVMLPDGDGIEFIPEIRKQFPGAVIIMISGHASIKLAVEATRKGADDFLEKPLSRDKLLITLNNFVRRLELEEKYASLQSDRFGDGLIGESDAIRNIRNLIQKIAPSNSKVLITGESGTGKEIVAHLIHQMSERRDEPYVKINCSAIPEELIEAELFGAEKGAYTGSTERREGRFRQADGGTLFLDEIADMSPATQTKVLRVLQDGRFERVGGTETLSTDVRIVAATNKNLEQAVKEGRFREDLYFRLHVVPLYLPPLRERGKDIEILARHFLEYFRKENNKRPMNISSAVMKLFRRYPWPGNVRELKNVIERMVIMSDGDELDIRHVPAELQRARQDSSQLFSGEPSLRDFRDQAEGQYIRQLMEKNENNVARVAEILQVDRTYLYKKLRKLGLRK